MNKQNLDSFYSFLQKYQISPKKLSDYIAAFTHPSFTRAYKKMTSETDYQSLEFLGDSILQFLSSKYLYEKYKGVSAGQLTLMRAKLVSTKNLCDLSKKMDLYSFLRTGPGLTKNDVLKSTKVGADIYESFIAALFLDQGVQKVYMFLCQTLFKTEFDTESLKDAKTAFQEYVQSFSRSSVTYQTQQHENYFIAKALHDNKLFGQGKGKNKLEAEENAAKVALEKLAVNQKQNSNSIEEE
ncbi:ribonuclease III [Mycoplasmopsis mucosicanis]|uniref:Ribonuclease 3 n=1 Tax=Mycoplasmopsis mucosicanis TaxID=458208 RepID=A0A507SSM7_9BACT|nr:ribonuclease III [Mycoplasmopsis mucosicanis]TQC54096.1 ribonuclease III [Mycoplasmopsis mucosicanis]